MVATLEDVEVTAPRPGVCVVSLRGEHDAATRVSMSELFHDLVLTNDLVVADVTQAQFIDSAMLSTFFVAEKLAREQGKDFRIQLGTEAIVKRAFELSGALDHLPWAASRDAVLNGSPVLAKQQQLSEGSDEVAA
jgi:anti-anti-sigma factor